jgi:hypothetical protein
MDIPYMYRTYSPIEIWVTDPSVIIKYFCDFHQIFQTNTNFSIYVMNTISVPTYEQ